jgi:hypothetical protein
MLIFHKKIFDHNVCNNLIQITGLKAALSLVRVSLIRILNQV